MCAVVLFAPVCLSALWGQYAFNRGAKPKSTALAVTAINSAGTISLGAGTSLSLGQSAQITLTLSVPAPEAGVTVILTSSDASIVTVTPSAFIPGGRTSPNVQPVVKGIGLGSAMIGAAAPGFTSDTKLAKVTAMLGFSPGTVSIIIPTTRSVALSEYKKISVAIEPFLA